MTRDVFLNIVTSMLAVFTSQLVAYPFLASQMSTKEYGFILTTMGIVNLIGVSLGNPLNNTRLLMDVQYKENKANGDFNRIIIKLMIVSLFSSLIIFSLMSFKIKEIFLLSLLIILIVFRSYYTVYYRIKINYIKNFYSTLFGSVGILIGILIYLISQNWIIIFLCSEIISCLYILKANPLINEGYEISEDYKKIVSKYSFLFGGAFVSSLVTYMDRFFIYPVLGSEYVSYYNISSFLGKTAGIVLLPISGVLLTYYAKESSLSIKEFYKRFSIFLGCSIFIYISILFFGPFIMKFLYPTIYLDALKYFNLATLGSILFILGNTVQPTMLRYSEDKWQTIIQVIYLIVYIILAILLMYLFGLFGFCIAVIMANLFKLVFMLYIINKSLGD